MNSDSGLYFTLGLLSGTVACTVTYFVLSWIKDFAQLIYVRPDRKHALRESKSLIDLIKKLINEAKSDIIGNDADDMINTEDTYQSVISKLESELLIKVDQLEKIVSHMISEMKKGLCYDDQNLRMLPSFVTSRPKGTEIGTVLALDCGGSNFRVCLVTLEGQGLIRSKQGKYVLPEDLKSGSGTALFDFFADSIKKFLDDIGMFINPNGPPKALGFTFSFPVKQTSIDKGCLIQWNKGFAVTGVAGLDVANLLNEAIRRKDLNIEVTALVNDTVGTLVAHSYKNPQTYIGVILGTGTNAAYVEKVEEVKKTDIQSSSGEIIINTEWGAYNEPSVLPVNKYDAILDRQSANPRIQIFEKMIAGMYLGEIVRIILSDLIYTGELFRGAGSDELNIPYGFDTSYMSRIER
jgi:hexokinase